METRLASTETTSPQIPTEDIHVVVLHNTEFYIRWEALGYGASFFLPTTMTFKQVLAELRPYARALKFKLVAYQRCEYGRYGVRVWRLR